MGQVDVKSEMINSLPHETIVFVDDDVDNFDGLRENIKTMTNIDQMEIRSALFTEVVESPERRPTKKQAVFTTPHSSGHWGLLWSVWLRFNSSSITSWNLTHFSCSVGSKLSMGTLCGKVV